MLLPSMQRRNVRGIPIPTSFARKAAAVPASERRKARCCLTNMRRMRTGRHYESKGSERAQWKEIVAREGKVGIPYTAPHPVAS